MVKIDNLDFLRGKLTTELDRIIDLLNRIRFIVSKHNLISGDFTESKLLDFLNSINI